MLQLIHIVLARQYQDQNDAVVFHFAQILPLTHCQISTVLFPFLFW